jgi:hypothetical protein
LPRTDKSCRPAFDFLSGFFLADFRKTPQTKTVSKKLPADNTEAKSLAGRFQL